MNELEMTLENNHSKAKGLGYMFYRICLVLSLLAIPLSVIGFFITLMGIGRDGNVSGHIFTATIYLVVAVLLIAFVRGAFNSRKLKKLSDTMKIDGFFNPEENDEQFTPAQKIYHAVDFKSGMVGVASVYREGFNRKKRLFFDADLIESYELVGSKLLLNLRSREIPTLAIMTLRGQRAYRNIEMLCNMGQAAKLSRKPGYQEKRDRMAKAGWVLERDY